MRLDYGLPMEDIVYHTESDHISGENRIHEYYTNTRLCVGDCLLEAIKDIREKITQVEQHRNPHINPTYAPVTFPFLKASNPMRDRPIPKQDYAYKAPSNSNNNYPPHRQHDATETHHQLRFPRPVPPKSYYDVARLVQHHRPGTSDGSAQPNGRARHSSTRSGNKIPAPRTVAHDDKDDGKADVSLNIFGIETIRDHTGREVFTTSPANIDSEIEASSAESGNRPYQSKTGALPMSFDS